MNNHYTVINASAGSGKTYQLVQKYLMICLKHKDGAKNCSKILALTFTNKASNEMKERIFKFLKEFSEPHYAENKDLINLQAVLAAEGEKIDLEELHSRAKETLSFILHNYSTLNISTIDKFNAKLVRNFTYELGLAKNFNLEINPDQYLKQAIDKLLSEIEENNPLSNTFIDYILYYLDQDKKVKLSQTLFDSSRQLLQDKNHQEITQNKRFDLEVYLKTKKKLQKEQDAHLEKIHEKIKEALALLQKNDLVIEDFSGKSNGLGSFFVQVKKYVDGERDSFPFPTSEERKQIDFRKGASPEGKKRGVESIVNAVIEPLLALRQEIIFHYIEHIKKERILKNLLPLKVHSDIQQELEKIEIENDLVFLSKFNILINEKLKDEPTDFIYEKIGTNFQHYFFDEFQDTSTLQWQNFLPIRDHCLATENTSFTLVGDPKQSIYRFRGGESQLMLNIINGTEKTSKQRTLINLKDNWRSAKNIVTFNNDLYQNIADSLEIEQYQNMFGKDAKQVAKSEIEGRVKLFFSEEENREGFFDAIGQKMLTDITDCLANGYQQKDITILTRNNKAIAAFCKMLEGQTIQLEDQEITIKTISEKGLTLDRAATINAVIAFLKWQNSPQNTLHLLLALYYLKELKKVNIQDFSEEMTHLLSLPSADDKIDYLESRFTMKFSLKETLSLNLYNRIEFFVKSFSIENVETDYILNFLEEVFLFSQKIGATLKDYLFYWDEEGHKVTIKNAESIEAIKIMTIHKAKGLEFPIVLYPDYTSKSNTDKEDWFSVAENENDELQKVTLQLFNKVLEPYDEKINEFNTYYHFKEKIDNYCSLYVATTRPKEQLYLYVNKKSELYPFIAHYNPNGLEEIEVYPTSSLQKNDKKTTKIPDNTQSIDALYPKSPWKSQLKIATPSKNYQERNAEVKTGIFVHELLSKINSKEQIKKVTESYKVEGKIDQMQKENIEKKLSLLVDSYPDYFSEEHTIYNEKEIMISDDETTQLYRPDKIIQKKEGYIIIDFKTGDPKEAHQEQIKSYQNCLEKLGKKVLKTELIYL